MTKLIWLSVIANAIYSLAVFRNIVTPSYILVLILINFMYYTKMEKMGQTCAAIIGILGVVITLLGYGTLAILITSIIIILAYTKEKIVESNQRKYDEKFRKNNAKNI